MAIYHLSCSPISRSSGRSSVAAAAYRAGEKIKNERDGLTHDYTRKKEVVYKEVLTPENAPERFKDRATLWNEVEKTEKRSNSRTAREFDIALPVELSREEQQKLIRDFANESLVKRGMCADVCIHDKGDGNPHAHIMVTTRLVSPEGFTKKQREWDKKSMLQEWRKEWADTCNRELEKRQIKTIDHRSYAEQGKIQLPTVHEGVAARNMQSKGKETDKAKYNEEVRAANMAFDKDLHDVAQQMNELRREAAAIEQRQKEAAEQETQRQKQAEQETQRRERQEQERRERERQQAREREREQPEQKPTPDTVRKSAGADLREGEPRQPSPASMGQTLSDTKARYMETLEQTGRAQASYNKYGETARRAQQDAQDIQGRTKAIDSMQGQIDQLQSRRAGLGVFSRQEKRSIDSQIASLQHSKQQATAALKQAHGITPEQAPATVKKLQQQGQEATRQQQAQRPALEQLKQTQRELALTYKQTKVMADLQPENVRAQIGAAEKQADKAREPAASSKTPQGSMSMGQYTQRIKAERDLQNISPKEYPTIKASLPPAAQKQLETRDKGAQAPSYAKGAQTRTQGRTGPTGPSRGGLDR